MLNSLTFPHCVSSIQLSSSRGEGAVGRRKSSSGSAEMLGSLTRSMDRVKIRCSGSLRGEKDVMEGRLERPKKK